MVNIVRAEHAARQDKSGVMEYINSQRDPSLTWQDVEWKASRWNGPLVIKGVLTVEDCPGRLYLCSRRCFARPSRNHLRWRNPARHSCCQGARAGRTRLQYRARLPFWTGCLRSGRCRTSAHSVTQRSRAHDGPRWLQFSQKAGSKLRSKAPLTTI